MLEEALKEQLREHFNKMTVAVTLRQHRGEHERREELRQMLDSVAALSPLISVEDAPADQDGEITGGASFDIVRQSGATGIRFHGVPGGHEFSSLVLAILQAGGLPIRIDPGVQAIVRELPGTMAFQTVVSLSCHNCPDVVQTLNSLALLNPAISHEMIDGALYPEFVEKHKVQGVPAVFLNGEPFASGKIDAGQILEILMKRSDHRAQVRHPESRFKVAIVGGGPAGVAAAIYTARKGLSVALVADRLGGQVKDTMGIENLITVDRTTGPELTAALGGLLRAHEITIREHLRVVRIEDGEPYKKLILNSGESILSESVIIATGARWRELGVPGEKQYLGHGVAYCPHCDGPFFKDRDVAVVGGGNSGVEAALDLAGIVKSVHLFEFTDRLNADRILLDRLEKTPNITVSVSAEVKSIAGDGEKVTGIEFLDRSTQEKRSLPLDGVFIQIGLVPHTDFVADLLERNRFGEIVVDDHGRTSVPGIFACGDATTVPYKQIAIALGDGARAALAVFEYLLKKPVAA
ncbi:MAG: alkyl hydroperoxide reductase subunit F [Spirochaetales bacterium]|nr:alkyl hydroperoxide reductase subunit F [Spirochaetales bacterium]